ncbi:MAG TPA: penicillin acylase family protein, partial [Anaerolineales bacterium]
MFTLQQWLNPVVGSGLAWLSKDSFPQTDGALEMVGLHRPVKIYRDRLGIPHLRAENIHDVIFAQGFVHAQDRLWQMDFSRRLVSGRLAEVAGSAVVSLDRAMRILGLRGIAVREFDLLDPETQALLEAYASGVNARIQQRKLPLEFFLLGYRPEPWTPVDSLSWPKMIAWGLSGNWESELLRAALINRVGADQAGELELENLQPWPDQLSTIL